jgi:hypothetical protein
MLEYKSVDPIHETLQMNNIISMLCRFIILYKTLHSKFVKLIFV